MELHTILASCKIPHWIEEDCVHLDPLVLSNKTFTFMIDVDCYN